MTIRAGLIGLLGLLALSAAAQPIDGRLSIETPYSADRLSDRSTMVLGQLSTRLGARWTLAGSAQYNLGNLGALRSECRSEDKVRGLLAFDVTRDLAVYSYYERRFSLEQERVVVGISWKFRVAKGGGENK